MELFYNRIVLSIKKIELPTTSTCTNFPLQEYAKSVSTKKAEQQKSIEEEMKMLQFHAPIEMASIYRRLS